MTRDLTPRGFENYGRLTDDHGNEIVVRESSEVGPPRAWVFCNPKTEPEHPMFTTRIDITPYLNREQARQLARALLLFARRTK